MPRSTFPARPYIAIRPVDDFERPLVGEMPVRRKDYGPAIGLLIIVLTVSATVGVFFAVGFVLLGGS